MPDSTIYDVAELAGVSITTVSRVINLPEQVNEATRMRVLAAIDQLNFVPKAEAIARARKVTGQIGVISPFFTFHSFVDRLRGLVTALTPTPYELVIYYVDSSARRDGLLVNLAITRRLAGLIVLALPFDESAAQRLLAHGLETVLIEAPQPLFSSVAIDDAAGGRMAAEYLIQKGHQRCGFVGDSAVPDYAIYTSGWRLAGYRRALLDAGLALPDEYVGLASHGIEQARQLAHRLLSLPQPPTAIFAASDIQALGVLSAARERGLSLPRDLAVIGFDDIEMAAFLGLTTIRQQLNQSGIVAAELLLARLADRSLPIQRVTLPLTLVPRETA